MLPARDVKCGLRMRLLVSFQIVLMDNLTFHHCRVDQHSSQTPQPHQWSRECKEAPLLCECRSGNLLATRQQTMPCHFLPKTWIDVKRVQVWRVWSQLRLLGIQEEPGLPRHNLNYLYHPCLRHQSRETCSCQHDIFLFYQVFFFLHEMCFKWFSSHLS